MAVYPGRDNLVRVTAVKTDSGTYLRSIHHLCLLDPANVSKLNDHPAPGENVAATKA